MMSCFLSPNPHFNAVLLPYNLLQASSLPHRIIPIFFFYSTTPTTKGHRRQFLPITKTVKKTIKPIESSGSQAQVGTTNGDRGEEDSDVCPVECVREFNTDEEFLRILDRAKESHSLVVVDFYRTSCGSCKYIEQGFAKLCRGSGDKDAPVVFLKHNVIDEYDEQSEVADRLRIKAVPLFHFYKDGVLLEAFPTRDKERIIAAISKYSSA